MAEDFSISVGSRNETLILNEYKGKFAIISGYEGRDGKNYFSMVFPRDAKTKEPRDTAIPMKVPIGDNRDEAISTLRQMIAALQRPSNDPVSASKAPRGEDLDLPF